MEKKLKRLYLELSIAIYKSRRVKTADLRIAIEKIESSIKGAFYIYEDGSASPLELVSNGDAPGEDASLHFLLGCSGQLRAFKSEAKAKSAYLKFK